MVNIAPKLQLTVTLIAYNKLVVVCHLLNNELKIILATCYTVGSYLLQWSVF